MLKVGIIGLGFVGMSLAKTLSKLEDIELVGIDYQGGRIKAANLDTDIKIKASGEEEVLQGCDIYLICVGTPMSSAGPNDHYVIAAAKMIERQAKPGALAIIESTVPIGFMYKEFYPIMERSGLLAAYSPERISPNSKDYNLSNTTKLLAATSQDAQEIAYNFYKKFVSNVVVSDSVIEVEAAKILENSYRLINIDFINQFQLACQEAGLDANNILDLASTKEFGFQRFDPGVGAGGHCIPVDPEFLLHYLKAKGAALPMLELAATSNKDRPRKLLAKLEERHGKLDGKNVLVVGIAYKKNVADARNSSGNVIFNTLLNRGIAVEWYDDMVVYHESRTSTKPSKKHDVVILVVKHDNMDLTDIREDALVVDISRGEV